MLKWPKRQIHHFLFSVIIVQSMLKLCISDRLYSYIVCLHKKFVNNNCVRWCYSADPCHLETIPELSLRWRHLSDKWLSVKGTWNTKHGITLHWLYSNNQSIKLHSLEPNCRGFGWRKEVNLVWEGLFQYEYKCCCIILLSYLMSVSASILWLLYHYVLIFVRKYFMLGPL
jgi:hypothetical protein